MALFDFLFGSQSAKPMAISNPLQDSINTTAADSLARFRNRRNQILDQSGALFPGLYADADRAARQGLGDIDFASNSLRGFDPTANYERIRSGDINALQGLISALSGAGSAEESAISARLGLAGRPGSSARNILRSTRLGGTFAPVANTIFGNLGSTSRGLAESTFNRARGLTSLASARPRLFSDLYGFANAPLDAEAEALGSEVGAFGPLSSATKNNFAGMDIKRKAGLLDFPLRLAETAAGTIGSVSDAVTGLGGMNNSFRNWDSPSFWNNTNSMLDRWGDSPYGGTRTRNNGYFGGWGV